MEITKKIQWLKISDFSMANPIECKVFDCTTEPGKFGNDIILVFVCELPKGVLVTRKITLFGDNLDKCIDKWSTDSTKWNLKQFRIHRINSVIDNKSINVLELL